MNPDQHRNALNRHDRLHWYEIQSILGQGGFGITYLARDTNLDQLVAIKEYLPTEFSTRDEANTVQPISEKHTEIFDWGKKRFLEEAKTLAQFRHPNVIRVSSFFENNNTGYMVMDYEEGTDLAAMIKAGEKFDEQRILGLMLPILDGLGQIHAQGFIHRDIKPANIFIRTDGSPVLIDFGSARQAIGGQTKTMTSLVTPGFAPFEQYHDAEGKQGPWTDIYSLGATCYSMITGKPPIDALKRGMARIDHSIDAYLHLTDLNAGERYSQYLLQAIDYALEFKEGDRPQNVAEWRATLLGEAPVPQAVTRIGDAAADADGAANDGSTLVVTRPGENSQAAAAYAVTEPVTGPDAATVPATAPPTEAASENARTSAAAPPAPAARPGKGRGALVAVALLAAVLLGLGALYQLRQPSPTATGIPPAAPAEPELGRAEAARLAAEKEALRQQQARLAAEKEKLEAEQARIEAEKALQAERARKAAAAEALRQEQARLAAEKEKLEQEQARLAAEKQRQAELARQKAAEEKRRLELARQQAEEAKRRQELERQAALAQQQASTQPNADAADDKRSQPAPADPYADVSGTYRPDDGFEEVRLQQSGNRIRGTIGTKGSTLEGRRDGNRITFAFNYSRTGYGFKDGFGQFTISADGQRLTGSRSGGGFPPESGWNLRRKAGN